MMSLIIMSVKNNCLHRANQYQHFETKLGEFDAIPTE